MPINQKYLAVFEFDQIFHIYNRTNNQELLFKNSDNYFFFLRQFDYYISPIAETFSWNLLPNHFHFLIRIKPLTIIQDWIESLPDEKRTKSEQHFLADNNINTLVEMAFKRLFTSYAMAFNKMHKRQGNLFSRTFKRVCILKDNQFTQAIIYINANAQKHHLAKDFSTYPWTSYHSIISDRPTKILRAEVIDWFGSIEQFMIVHNEMSEYYADSNGPIEEEEDF